MDDTMSVINDSILIAALNPKSVTPTGSYFICTPSVTDTDRDYALFVDDISDFGDLLEDRGWAVTWDDPDYVIGENGEIPFITARLGDINLIVFDQEAGFYAFSKATDVAIMLNLTEKSHRVTLFQAVCGGRGEGFFEREDFDDV